MNINNPSSNNPGHNPTPEDQPNLWTDWLLFQTTEHTNPSL